MLNRVVCNKAETNQQRCYVIRGFHVFDFVINLSCYFVSSQDLQADVLAHKDDFEKVKDSAQDISKSTGDGRTASYANQLYSRYQTLAASIQVRYKRIKMLLIF